MSAITQSNAGCSLNDGALLVSEPRTSSLDRRLGPLDAAAVVVSNVIGGGILFTLAYPELAVRLARIIHRWALTTSSGSAFTKSQCRSAKQAWARCIATDAKVKRQVAVKI